MSDPTSTRAFADLLAQTRKLYKHSEIDLEKLHDGEFMGEFVKLAVAGAMHAKVDKSTPADLVCLIRALTDIVSNVGVATAMCQLAQISGVQRINNGGSTYACIAAKTDDSDKTFTVLLFCNRMGMSAEMVAEHILRHAPSKHEQL